MSIDFRMPGMDRRVHGPCHRCGWVADTSRVDRRRASRLNLGSHAALLCDDCVEDLRQRTASTVRTESVAHTESTLRHPSHRSRNVA